MKRLTVFLFLLCFSLSSFADTLTLKPGHPESYVVKKGDTLWDISAHFLDDPWRWPTLWGSNPQIANPHLIYPGDRLTLVFIDGVPRLVVKPHVRKSPQGRIIPKGDAIPAIDLSLIQPYLIHNRVVEPQWFNAQPQIVGGERESRLHSQSDVIYIQGELVKGAKYGIYHQGRVFKDEQGEALGQEVILAASGRVIESGAISKVKLLSSLQETKAGYRILPIEDEALLPAYFSPKAANVDMPVSVLASGKNIRAMGKFDVVYLDAGRRENIEPGQVFSIFKAGDEVILGRSNQPVQPNDRNRYDKVIAAISPSDALTMPDIYLGQLMVFKAFDNVSMGIILINDRPVRIADKLVNPVRLLK